MTLVMTAVAEDFERLMVRWVEQTDGGSPYSSSVMRIAAFPEMYAKNRDSLPQNDSDRAFWLVCRASQILDRQIYDVTDDQVAAQMADTAAAYLTEALKLDSACADAERMLYALEQHAHDQTVSWLRSSSQRVKEACEARAAEVGFELVDGTWGRCAYLRPYLRWQLALANEELNCGRYRRALEVCDEIMRLDVSDSVGARLVAAYTLVKLEDAVGLSMLISRFRGESNAWFDLSRCFMAYKQRRHDDAASILHDIARSYPQAAHTLMLQDELPAGLFNCHLEFAPESADELYIAMSEAAVVVDENCGDYMSPLSYWITRDPVILKQFEDEKELFQQAVDMRQAVGANDAPESDANTGESGANTGESGANTGESGANENEGDDAGEEKGAGDDRSL